MTIWNNLVANFKRGWDWADGPTASLKKGARRGELLELQRLHSSASSALASLDILEPDHVAEIATRFAEISCSECENPPAPWLNQLLADFSFALFHSAGIFTPPKPIVFSELNFKEEATLRSLLERQVTFAVDPEPKIVEMGVIISFFIEGFLTYLPASCFDPTDSATPRFSVALIDLFNTPHDALDGLLNVLLTDQDKRDSGLLRAIESRVERNMLIASGINPNDHQTSAKVKLPGDQRQLPGSELARQYFAGTAFEKLLTGVAQYQLPTSARFEHCHVVGGSGHGKTQLLQSLILSDLQDSSAEPPAVVVIDSQGDMIGNIARLQLFDPELPGSLADRLVIIDPTDIAFPPAFNLFYVDQGRLDTCNEFEREKILNGTIELYEYIFGALLGAELTQKQSVIFRYLARLMLSIPGATIHTLRQLMEDGARFKPYMEQLSGTTRQFFATEFFHPSFTATKSQILKRLWGILANPSFERMFSSRENKVDLFEALGSGKIVLINTAKDFLKQEGCAILGRFMIARLLQAALERASLQPSERRPTFVFVDEAHDYFDGNIEHLLNQARKYAIGLTFAHQNLGQLSASLKASIMASTSIKLAGGVSAKDARALAEEMLCETSLLQEPRKHKTHTEFACFVRNHLERPLKVSVPLGLLEEQPRLEQDKRSLLVGLNRTRYCSNAIEIDHEIEKYQTPLTPPVDPVHSKPEAMTTQAAKPSISDYPSERPPADTSKPLTRTPRKPKPKIPNLGQGGAKHTYLQQLIKQAAQDRGFHAVIEQSVLDGKGRIDVALQMGDTKIACEISVTTKPDHEVANITKCLQAGYARICVIAENKRQVGAIRKAAKAELSIDKMANVSFLLPDEFLAYLDELQAEASSAETTVRGYTVKVKHKALSPEQSQERRAAIAGVIAKSMAQTKDSS